MGALVGIRKAPGATTVGIMVKRVCFGSACLITAAVLALAGCNEPARMDSLAREVANLQTQVAEARAQIVTLRDEAKAAHALAEEVASLRSDIGIERMLRGLDDMEKIAELRPGADGFSTIRSEYGTLTVSLEDVQPYANGSRVLLRFGNPLSASLSGMTASVEFGNVDAEGNTVPSKTKDIAPSDTLSGGSWNDVQVVLDGIPPDRLGYVTVRHLRFSTISLSSSPRVVK